MVANNNIKLQINTGEGITYGIDRQLDAEFGKDITLKGSVWNQIMDVIKADKATTNPQYGGGNTDINNGKHFIVKEGVYEISQTAWASIKQIATQALGKPVVKPTEPKKEVQTEDSKTIIENLLSKEDIELRAEELEEVVKKYNTMKEFNCGNQTPEERAINYAKGLKYATKEDLFKSAYLNNTTTKAAIELEAVKENPGTKAAFIDSAKEQVELFDSKEGDGKINFTEYVAKEIADAGVDIENLPDDTAAQLISQSKATFDLLNIDGDTFLDKEEMAALTYTMSSYDDGEIKQDTSTEITYNEWKGVNEALAGFGNIATSLPANTAKELKDKLTAGNIFGEGNKNSSNYIRGVIDIIENDCKDMLTPEELINLKYFIKTYTQNAANFKK